MSSVRVLVGTRKGAFILTADGKRDRWDVSGPHFRGLGDLPRQGIARRSEPAVRIADQRLVRPGDPALRRRRQDVGDRSATSSSTTAMPGTHQWYDGTPHPWEFKRVWHLEPSLTDPDTVYAGVEDAALFRSTDGGQTWQELSGLRGTRLRALVAARRRRHVPAHDPARPDATRSGCSSPSPPPARSAPTTAARRGQPINRGLALGADSGSRPPRSATACTASRCTRRVPTCCSCRSIGTSCAATTRANRGARSAVTCRPTSASRSTCTRTSRRRSTSCRSRATREHFPPDGKLRVYRSRTGGNEWEPLTKGLPQSDCYVNVLRDAMAVDSLDSVRRLLRHHRRAGVRVGRRRRQLDADRARPAGGAVGRGADAAMIRVVLPSAPADAGARRRRGDARGRRASRHAARRARRARGALSDAARHDPRSRHAAARGRSCGSSPASRTCRTSRRTRRFPTPSRSGAEPFLIVGAMAGG